MTPQDALSFLGNDPIKNINMIHFIRNNPVQSIEQIDNSIIARGRSDQNWVYISCSEKIKIGRVLNKLNDNDRFFAAVENWMMPYFSDRWDIRWRLSTWKLYLPENMEIAEPDADIVSPLNPDEAQYIYDNSGYQDVTTPEYIRDRLEKGVSAGIYINGRLAAWGLTHDDNAIGFLYVSNDFRRMGFASQISRFIIKRLREEGHTPFLHIEPKNENSMNLALKLGFVKDRQINWFEVYRNDKWKKTKSQRNLN